MTDSAFARARAEFPAAVSGPYLNVAARSILSRTTRAAVDAYLDSHMSGASKKETWDPIGKRCKERFARLIGAQAGEIAFTHNVSEGLNVVAASFPWREGDNVVLCSTVEHPNNVYAWQNLRSRGVTLKIVAPKGDALDTDAMLAAVDARTRLMSVATVSFTPGYRADTKALGRACRERGVFLMVDAVQSTGVLVTDVAREGIDGLATSTSKGLLGLYGLGFLYVDRNWVDRLKPAYLARFSVDQGTAHESEMGSLDFALQPDARRFEVGHLPWPGIFAADASLGQILDLGPSAVEAHALALARRLADGLAALGLDVCRPPDPAAATHIVTAGRLGRGNFYDTADSRLNAIARRLEGANVRFSIRRGLLRFAAHFYNTEDDIDAVLGLAREALSRAAAE